MTDRETPEDVTRVDATGESSDGPTAASGDWCPECFKLHGYLHDRSCRRWRHSVPVGWEGDEQNNTPRVAASSACSSVVQKATEPGVPEASESGTARNRRSGDATPEGRGLGVVVRRASAVSPSPLLTALREMVERWRTTANSAREIGGEDSAACSIDEMCDEIEALLTFEAQPVVDR